jgi:ribosomal protein L33
MAGKIVCRDTKCKRFTTNINQQNWVEVVFMGLICVKRSYLTTVSGNTTPNKLLSMFCAYLLHYYYRVNQNAINQS